MTPIVNGNVTINARTCLDYQFNVPANVTNAWVWGTFTAHGGTGNDIKVYIFDKTNLNYYNAGQKFNALYQSGQTTNATIRANIVCSGNYYLVLDNEFSVSQKTVNIRTYTIL